MESTYEVRLPSEVRRFTQLFTDVFSAGLQHVSAPMTCVGLGGYVPKLWFWVLVPFLLAALILVGALFYLAIVKRVRLANLPSRLLGLALPPVIKLLFLAYPYVSNVAFSAWPCYDFEESRWLIVDVAIQCGSPAHDQALASAWIAVALYPFAQLVGFFLLLWFSRDAIKTNRPTKLSLATKFLWRDYEPQFYWWEIVEMTRRVVLIGLMVTIQQGTLLQIVLGALFTAVFLVVQMQAKPYVKETDDFLALSGSFSLLVIFLCFTVFKMGMLTELPEFAQRMTREQVNTS